MIKELQNSKKIYKQIRNYNKNIIKDKEKLPLVHLCINFKTNLNPPCEIKIYNKIREFRNKGLEPMYRLRLFMLSHNNCNINYCTRYYGNKTYYDEKIQKYVSYNIEKPF